MPKNVPLSADQIRAILSLRDQGSSERAIGKQMNLSASTVHDVLKRNGYSGAPASEPKAQAVKEKPSNGRELPGETNVPVDLRDENGGDTSIVTPDKPLSVEEIAALFKIDLKVWLATNVKTNRWQGFYKASKVFDPKTKSTIQKHEKVALFQTTVTWRRIMGETVELMLLDFLRANVTALPKPPLGKSIRGTAPKGVQPGTGQMVSWGLWDAHLGMYAWHSEVGESMDLPTAISRVTNSIDDMAAELSGYPIEEIVMPIGNDFLHYDNTRQKTTNGEHHLDADGRYAKVFTAGLRCLIYMIERALEIAPKVKVLYVPGNHDLHSSYTLCVALSQRFRNDPRVEFDLRANPRKYVRFGGTLLGFDHGQMANAKQLSLILSAECKADWSESTYREVQVGHTHQRRVTEFESVTPTNGVTVRVNPALCNVDVWHHTQGLIGEPMKSVEAWRYDRTGYRGSHVAWARDDHSEAFKKVTL